MHVNSTRTVLGRCGADAQAPAGSTQPCTRHLSTNPMHVPDPPIRCPPPRPASPGRRCICTLALNQSKSKPCRCRTELGHPCMYVHALTPLVLEVSAKQHRQR